MLSEPLIQFSIDGWSCVPSLLFAWAQTMVEAMKRMGTSLRRSQACVAAVCAPNPAEATADRPLRWRLPETHRQASCGVTAPFSWVLVHTVQLRPPSVYSPVLCRFWQLCPGVNGHLLREDVCHTHTQSPTPAADHCRPVPPQETLKHSCVSVSVGSLGPGAHKVCLSPLSVSGGNGV